MIPQYKPPTRFLQAQTVRLRLVNRVGPVLCFRRPCIPAPPGTGSFTAVDPPRRRHAKPASALALCLGGLVSRTRFGMARRRL